MTFEVFSVPVSGIITNGQNGFAENRFCERSRRCILSDYTLSDYRAATILFCGFIVFYLCMRGNRKDDDELPA